MTVAFHVWNPFQVIQIREIIKNHDDSVLLFERRKAMDFDRVFDSQILTDLGIPIHEVSTSDLARIDGKYEAVVIQTPYRYVEQLEKTKLIGAQYSMTKERHQHGSWRALCSLNLVYGRYSYDRVVNFAPASIVGNPRFDPWFNGALKQEKIDKIRSLLDPNKKTVLYAPTWGDLSSVPVFKNAIAGLANEYNLLVKMHHNTDALELDRRAAIQQAGAFAMFGASDDSLDLLACSDVVISDYSGAIFDAINVGKPVVLLQHQPEKLSAFKFGMESIEYARRDDIGFLASEPSEVECAVRRTFDCPNKFKSGNDNLRSECFGLQKGSGAAAAKAIKQVLQAGTERPVYQIYLRDELRQCRGVSEELRELRLARKNTQFTGAFKKKLKIWRSKLLDKTVPVLSGIVLSSVKYSPSTIELWGRLFGGKWLVNQSRYLAQHGLDSVALTTAAAASERVWRGRAHYLSLSHKQNHLAGIRHLWETRHFCTGLNWALDAVTAIKAGHILKIDQQELGAFRKDAVHILTSQGENSTTKIASAEALVKLREIDAAYSLLNLCGPTPKVEKIRSKISNLTARSEEWSTLIQLATNNETIYNPADQIGLYRGIATRVGDAGQSKVIEFHVGTYFGNVVTKADPVAHARICDFQRGLLKHLSDDGFVIVPKHQYWLNVACPSGAWPAISYHTSGAGGVWLHLKDSAVPDLFRYDLQGYAGWSELASLEELPAYVNEVRAMDVDEAWSAIQRDVVHSKVSKYLQSGTEFSLPNKPYFFFPLQLLDDTVAQLAWVPMLQAVTVAREVAKERGFALVIKRHPLCTRRDVKKFINKFERFPEVIVTDAPIFDIIDQAHAVVTVNSGVGFEALLRGRRVITVGASEYGLMTTKAKTSSALKEVLLADSPPPPLSEIKRFVWLYRSRCVSTNSYDPIVDWANKVAKLTVNVIENR